VLKKNKMLRVGLTGGIGSGKTTVARIFESLGIPVYYADEAARRLMQEDVALVHAITEKFGTGVYHDGKLDRSYLASIVFSDSAKIAWLNSLIHPATIADAKEWMSKQQAPYAIKEAALLFESGASEGLDLIIGVTAPEKLRIKRVMQRDQQTEKEIQRRMQYQLEESVKQKLCDFTIQNDETTPLLAQVLAIDEELRKRVTQPKPQ
jgi:dephospho-CoA kinase